jgi:4-hydroxy-L-threonine phosphate dehydrogenase PdxA
MSFLAGRLAGKEAAYFFQESKQAVTKLAQKNNHNHNHNPISKPNAADERQHLQDHADVLPEVLRHSLPSKLFRDETVTATSS